AARKPAAEAGTAILIMSSSAFPIAPKTIVACPTVV
ncbi:unnamed protein product, partial [Rotaria magnacalcarata]